MNEFTTSCPQCKEKLDIPFEYFGQQVECPACHKIFMAEMTLPENKNNKLLIVSSLFLAIAGLAYAISRGEWGALIISTGVLVIVGLGTYVFERRKQKKLLAPLTQLLQELEPQNTTAQKKTIRFNKPTSSETASEKQTSRKQFFEKRLPTKPIPSGYIPTIIFTKILWVMGVIAICGGLLTFIGGIINESVKYTQAQNEYKRELKKYEYEFIKYVMTKKEYDKLRTDSKEAQQHRFNTMQQPQVPLKQSSSFNPILPLSGVGSMFIGFFILVIAGFLNLYCDKARNIAYLMTMKEYELLNRE